MRVVSLAITLLLLTAPTIAHGEVLLMPEELVEYAEKKGCSQVHDFYARPGPVNPPYVYFYPNAYSAVFWCQVREGDKTRYFLITMLVDDLHESKRCPTKIEWKYTYPDGLSILIDRETTLDNYVYLKNPKKKGPKDVKMSDNAIVSSYDGVSVAFYCHRGKWLVRQRH